MSENFIQTLPTKFVGNTVEICGESGEQWLNDLPQIIEELSNNWHLIIEKPYGNLSYNFVAPCFCADGSEAVLKIALPLNNPEIFNEARYLQVQKGKGVVKILNFEEKFRAMLLEKLDPGKHLKENFANDPDKAVEIAVNLLKKLIRQPSADFGFVTLENWFENCFKRARKTDFPQSYLERTRESFVEFNKTSQKFLLHGDFHHENILSAGKETFAVIDPKGIIGEIGYEIAVFLNNHLWWLAAKSDAEEKLDNAIHKFSDAFDISTTDLKKWAFAQIVLSAWWTFEENGNNCERELAFAEFWNV